VRLDAGAASLCPAKGKESVAMCGRFTYRYTWSEIHALYRLTTPPANLQPRYNTCPTTPINTVVARDGQNELVPMRWGLIPSWWKMKAKETPATFNARAETVGEKPMFRSAFQRNRCLIRRPATTNGRIRLTANGCTIHDRMPVILEAADFEAWLTGGAGSELLKPAANDLPQKWPVSRRVNSSQSRSRKSAQDDKWSFCLTTGRLCPRIRRDHDQTTAPEPYSGL
jgi:putative SOS response-associated peptidase YedK